MLQQTNKPINLLDNQTNKGSNTNISQGNYNLTATGIFSTNDENIQSTSSTAITITTTTTTKTTATTAATIADVSSIIQNYEKEWHDLSNICEDINLNKLREISNNGQIEKSKFRSICWGVLLNVLHGNSTLWIEQRRLHRIYYQDIKKSHISNPRCSSVDDHHPTQQKFTKIDLIKDNPLSQSKQSIWNQFFLDVDLCAIIKQDVVRSFPGEKFYRRQNVQSMMVNILFCYAREHPELCYRQGMHEILAPILFVIHKDQIQMKHIIELSLKQIAEHTNSDDSGSVNDKSFPIVNCTIQEMLDDRYIEEDSYFIFSKIMNNIEPYYRVNETQTLDKTHLKNKNRTSSPDDCYKSNVEVVGQLKSIRDKILAVNDPVLNNHLLALDISLPIFGIRWLRLLFGREIPLQDLLILWDAIFADKKHFQLCNYILVSMLVGIRQTLLTGDYSSCLVQLMKYPENIDISLIIRYAMHIREPDIYQYPEGSFIKVPICNITTKPNLNVSTKKPARRNSIPDALTITNNKPKKTKQNDQTVEKNAKLQQKKYAALINKPYTDEQLNIRINNIQNSTALAAMRFNTTSLNGESDPNIIDGFLENSPELLRLQLENSFKIMTITRLKLIKYLAILRKHHPGSSINEIHQTVDGIEELCSLLSINPGSPYCPPIPVERAFEANEPIIKANNIPLTKETNKTNVDETTKTKLTELEAKKHFINSQQPENDFEFVVTTDGGIIGTLCSLSNELLNNIPFNQSNSDDNAKCVMDVPNENQTISRYILPDDHSLSIKVKQMLSKKTEVELNKFDVAVNLNTQRRRCVSENTMSLPSRDPTNQCGGGGGSFDCNDYYESDGDTANGGI